MVRLGLQSLKPQQWRRYIVFKILMQIPKKSNIWKTVRVTEIFQKTIQVQNTAAKFEDLKKNGLNFIIPPGIDDFLTFSFGII